MMTRSSIGGPSFSLSVLSFNRGREDGNPFSGAGWTPSSTLGFPMLKQSRRSWTATPAAIGRRRPAVSADDLARERRWDIQVATVGSNPLAPTTCKSRLSTRAEDGLCASLSRILER